MKTASKVADKTVCSVVCDTKISKFFQSCCFAIAYTQPSLSLP